MYTANSIYNHIIHNPNADDYGYWRVFTTSSQANRTINELGIHKGELHKIAFVLQEYVKYKSILYFESVPYVDVDYSGEHNGNINGMCKNVVVCTTSIDKLRNAIKNNPSIKMRESVHSANSVDLFYVSDENLKKSALEKAQKYLSEEELKALGVDS